MSLVAAGFFSHLRDDERSNGVCLAFEHFSCELFPAVVCSGPAEWL
jgi:hypothetical protein